MCISFPYFHFYYNLRGRIILLFQIYINAFMLSGKLKKNLTMLLSKSIKFNEYSTDVVQYQER